MKIHRLLLTLASAGLMAVAAQPAPAADPSCSLPGVVVATDPAGDETGAPATSFADILSLSIAEPGSNLLVFTLKMSDLATVLPDQAWIVRFSADVAPDDGDVEYFVAMVTGPDATPHFIYGTDGPPDPLGETPNVFNPQGSLDASSTFNADGTVSLALDKSKVPGLVNGGGVSAIVPVTNKITPTDGTVPFWYGFRSVSTTELAYDDVATVDDYVIGQGNCGGKSGLLGLGAMPLPAVFALLGMAALRRRKIS